MKRSASVCSSLLAALLAFSAPPLSAAQTPAPPSPPAWVQESNRHAQVLLDVMAKYAPENAASFGVEGHDNDVVDLKPNYSQRQQADLQAAQTKLEATRATVTDPLVRQDLDILIKAAQDQQQTLRLTRELLLPFIDLGQFVFQGFQDLLDERIDKQRQKAVLVRLRRYVGAEQGYEPVTTLARARFEERLGEQELTGPWVVELQQYLDNQARYLDGIQDLLAGSGLKAGSAT